MDQQKEAAMKLAQLLKGGMQQNSGQQNKAIVKMLQDIGIKPTIMSVELGGDNTECLVIPLNELILKEYKYLTGVDANALMEGNVE